MKAVLTLLFVLTFGAFALANTNNTDVTKVNGIQMGIVLDDSLNNTVATSEITFTSENKVARLYMFKNSRVKKALSFRTKRNKAKLA